MEEQRVGGSLTLLELSQPRLFLLLDKNMICGIRRFISVAVFICAVATAMAATGDKATNARNIHRSNPQVAAGLIEVRIRRLHLVRPDLIPYPIAYEIIC